MLRHDRYDQSIQMNAAHGFILETFDNACDHSFGTECERTSHDPRRGVLEQDNQKQKVATQTLEWIHLRS